MRKRDLGMLKKFVVTAKGADATGKPKYKNVPVDIETYELLIGLVYVKGFGRRTQGALVRKLVDTEIEQIMKNKGEEKKLLEEYFKA